MAEREQQIKKPVTIDILRTAAQAGYVAEVHSSIQFASTPVTLAEGAELVSTALKAEAEKLERDAEVLQGLSQLSDDPRWQSKFGPRAEDLRTRASVSRRNAEERDEAIEDLKNIGPYLR